jgi:hypothetical protein
VLHAHYLMIAELPVLWIPALISAIGRERRSPAEPTHPHAPLFYWFQIFIILSPETFGKLGKKKQRMRKRFKLNSLGRPLWRVLWGREISLRLRGIGNRFAQL